MSPILSDFIHRSKRCAVCIVALSLCASVSAQVGKFRRDFAIGVNGGVLMNKVSFDPTIRQGMHMGSTFGFTARYTSEKYLGMYCAIQTEVNFAQSGWKETEKDRPETYERTVNYAQVPILARLGVGREQKGLQGFLVLGPQLGFVLSDSKKESPEWLNVRKGTLTAQYGPIQNKFEYGLTGGLGIEVNTRHAGHFMVEGRYFYALSDVFHNGKTDVFARSANGTIVAKVTYLFDIVKTKNPQK